MTTVRQQRYSWLLSVEAGTKGISDEKEFSVDGEPCWWTISASYPLAALVVGFRGLKLAITGAVKGGARYSIVGTFSPTQGARIAARGSVFSAWGNNIYVQAAQFGANPAIDLNVVAIPYASKIVDDSQPESLAINTITQVPDFGLAVTADPPFQTIEVLDNALNVLQTIAMGSAGVFSPVTPLGIFYRCTTSAAVFLWKCKNYL